MKFRAYAQQTVLSKRHPDADGNPGPLENEEVIATGTAKDGVASFDSEGHKVTRVVFYDGAGDAETVAASVDVNKAGDIEVELPSE